MAQGQHTPGPWTVTRSKMETDGAFDYAISADGVLVLAEVFGRDAKGGWPPSEANARLIAAAPEMLAALRQMVVNSKGDRKEYRDCHKKALAAIAKATGEEK